MEIHIPYHMPSPWEVGPNTQSMDGIQATTHPFIMPVVGSIPLVANTTSGPFVPTTATGIVYTTQPIAVGHFKGGMALQIGGLIASRTGTETIQVILSEFTPYGIATVLNTTLTYTGVANGATAQTAFQVPIPPCLVMTLTVVASQNWVSTSALYVMLRGNV